MNLKNQFRTETKDRKILQIQ